MMPNRRIVVIGDEDAVFGLGLIGLTGQVVTNIQEAKDRVQKAMADPNISLILLTDNWSAAQPESREESSANVVEIPSQQQGKSSIALKTTIEQALGIRLEH
jgi:vacuolar-type H+-ATPase subunit F/Vma7